MPAEPVLNFSYPLSSATGPWQSSANGIYMSSRPASAQTNTESVVPNGDQKEKEVESSDDGFDSRFELMEVEE